MALERIFKKLGKVFPRDEVDLIQIPDPESIKVIQAAPGEFGKAIVKLDATLTSVRGRPTTPEEYKSLEELYDLTHLSRE